MSRKDTAGWLVPWWLTPSFCIWSKCWFRQKSWPSGSASSVLSSFSRWVPLNAHPLWVHRNSGLMGHLECSMWTRQQGMGVGWREMHIAPISFAHDMLHCPIELHLKGHFQDSESRALKRSTGSPWEQSPARLPCPCSWPCCCLTVSLGSMCASGFLSGYAHCWF